MKVKNWTPAETWEAVVGNQSPAEFLAVSREKAPCTLEEAVKAYAKELNLMFDADYTPEELELIEGKLLQYIGGSVPRRISLDNGTSYQTSKTITTDNLVGCWDRITAAMDDETRERVHGELAPCGRREFLDRYLELAEEDLIIG